MQRFGYLLAVFIPTAAAAQTAALPSDTVTRFADLALSCVDREYPNKIAHVLNSPADARTPSELTPVFCGCYDWHSAVHGHWLLVRLCRLYPDAPFVLRARAALAERFTAAKVAAEVEYLGAPGRSSFERPYGLAWLLQLCAELHEWDDAAAREWSATLEPLERTAAERLRTWLPKLSHPVRTGEHSQTAFALGLVLDWARSRGDNAMVELVSKRARDYYGKDRGANLAFEPDGQAFLSPILAEADLMRRVMPSGEFARWLTGFLPELSAAPTGARSKVEWLPPAVVTDRKDPQLVHLDGLNLSRAWMLDGIVSGLPSDDPRGPRLAEAAKAHRKAGLDALTDQQYEGGHWLGSFATYLVTERGLRSE